jgi:hypothetical protein
MPGYISKLWREVSSRNNVSGDSFTQGPKVFSLSVSGGYSIVPSQSYFRVTYKLTKKLGLDGSDYDKNNTQWNNLDKAAESFCMPANLFQQCFVRLGNQDVSTIQNYLPQNHAVKCRLSKSESWKTTAGKVYKETLNFTERQKAFDPYVSSHKNKVILEQKDMDFLPSDATLVNNANSANTPPSTSYVELSIKDGTTVEHMKQLGFVKGNKFRWGYTFNDVYREAEHTITGDIQQGGSTYMMFPINGVLYDGNLSSKISDHPEFKLYSPDFSANNTRDMVVSGDKMSDSNFAIYQPSCGFFDISSGLGAGDYEISLLANQDYKKAVLQTLAETLYDDEGKVSGYNEWVPGVNYDFEIQDLRFYACMIKNNSPASSIETLHLIEQVCYNHDIQYGIDSQMEFTVPPSTKAITVFIQDDAAGKTTLVPPTYLSGAFNQGRDLRSIQMTFGQQTKPSTRWQSSMDIDNGESHMQQRYVETHTESGLIFNNGGCETIGDYIQEGPIYHFSFDRAADDQSSRVQMNVLINKSDQPSGSDDRKLRIYVTCHYSRTAKITTQNGYISDVSTLSI